MKYLGIQVIVLFFFFSFSNKKEQSKLVLKKLFWVALGLELRTSCFARPVALPLQPLCQPFSF
jgi:hypothetical protein